MALASVYPDSSPSQPTRRALLAGAAASPVLALPAVAYCAVIPAAEPDPHPAWARQAEAVIARLNTRGLVDDEDAPELCEEQNRLDGLIAHTPARTLAGVREQLALVARCIPHSVPGPIEDAALENALATLDRLAGEAGHV